MAVPAVVFHPEAVEESRAAYEWYAERSGLAATAFLAELDTAVDQISRSPAAWPTYTAGTRRFLLRRFHSSWSFGKTLMATSRSWPLHMVVGGRATGAADRILEPRVQT